MAEKVIIKNMLAALPQKTDCDSLVATDASGNPIYIKKSDLAQVMAELRFVPKNLSDFSELDNIFYNTNLATYYYSFSGNIPNVSAELSGQSGFVFIRKFGTASTIQVLVTGNNAIYIRSYTIGVNKWTEWKKQ